MKQFFQGFDMSKPTYSPWARGDMLPPCFPLSNDGIYRFYLKDHSSILYEFLYYT